MVVSTLFFAVFIMLTMGWAAMFAFGLYNVRLPTTATDGLIVVRPPFEEAQRDRGTGILDDDFFGRIPTSNIAPSGPGWIKPQGDVYAYAPLWSLEAFNSVKTNISAIDVLLPEWFAIDDQSMEIVTLTAPHQEDFRRFATFARGASELLPVVRTSTGLIDALVDAGNQQVIADLAVQIVLANDYDGICFNVVGVDPGAVDHVASFLTTVQSQMRQAERESCLIAGVSDALWQHPDAGKLADRIVVLAFETPGPFSAPGPLAPQDQIDTALAELFSKVDAHKVVVALGSFGMDWTSGTASPVQVDYFDVTTDAVLNDGDVIFDRAHQNSTTSFIDNLGRFHHLWLLDAVAAHNTLLGLSDQPLRGVAIWPVGNEDPGFWQLLVKDHPAEVPTQALLQKVPTAQHVRFAGQGALLSIRIGGHDGLRGLEFDPETRKITAARYSRLPTIFTITRWGHRQGNALYLTFDDGPDPVYTPQILDILAEYDVPAVFFMIGSQVLEYPDIVRRIVEEGHEIGVHTYTHPQFTDISALRLRLEMHATQILLADITGQNTLLFRAPYGLDENPRTNAQARALRVLLEEGYLVVGTQIDSKDWARQGPDAIAQNLQIALSGEGGVVLLHDGGGDRSETIEALGNFLPAAAKAGIPIVPIASVFGTGSDAPTTLIAASQDHLSHYSFAGIKILRETLTTIFFVTIIAGMTRSLVIVFLALRNRWHAKTLPDQRQPITVAIPAYNEAPVIARTIASVLASDCNIAEIIVVDDGSNDGTGDAVRQAFSGQPMVRLVTQDNQGKAEALNHAHRLASTPLIVAIDADTIIAPDAIGMLSRQFEDPEVGAVAGNVKVGNRRNLLTRIQAIEYITAQNLDRRAFEHLNGIMVVPGAIGAWRKTAVAAAGGYTTETLVEDADMTVSILRAGYRVAYEPDALAFTEAPETVRQFVRQRLRWNFGMLQIAWKHKGALRERSVVGLISIPDLLIFGVLFSLFAPLADIVMVINVARITSHLASDTATTSSALSIAIIAGYVAYLLSDLLLAAIAMSLEPDENWRLLPWVLTQRFFYRQIYWFVALRSVARALTGRFTGWRKLQRLATVSSETAAALSRSHNLIAQEPEADKSNGRAK